MSCCPGIKCRNTGSGYEKPSRGNAQTELDMRMKELLAARNADDTRIWGVVSTTPVVSAIPEKKEKKDTLENGRR